MLVPLGTAALCVSLVAVPFRPVRHVGSHSPHKLLEPSFTPPKVEDKGAEGVEPSPSLMKRVGHQFVCSGRWVRAASPGVPGSADSSFRFLRD
jgi:hypothetical protein